MVAAWALLLPAGACGRGDEASRAGGQQGAAQQTVAPVRAGLGRAASPQHLAAIDIDVDPDGRGLPAGSGTYATGAPVYAAKCARCHGVRGEGMATFPAVIGLPYDSTFRFGKDVTLAKTAGNYWPYATTLFDYIRRAMPHDAPGSLTSDEVYGLVAFILAGNQVIDRARVIDAQSLPAVEMPARRHFVRDDRGSGREFR